MTYRVLLSGPAVRDVGHRLPEAVAAAAIEFIYGPLAENPHQVGKPLRHQLEGRHSARRGQYRVIYRVDDHVVTVTVLRVSHRRDAYG